MSELYELPEGWEWEKLKNIIRIGCEKGFKPTVIDGKVPFIGMTDIDKYTGRNTKYILEDNDKVSKGKTKFQKNAILLGKITPCTQNNKTTIVPNEIDGGYATTEVYALHCLEKIVSLYLNYYIRSKRVNEFLVSSMIGATGRQRVPSNIVKNLDIPLPPLQEQKRIVAKLDALFEKIDRAIALHQKNMDEADVFMGSVLNDVFGELEGKYEKRKLESFDKKMSSGGTPSRKENNYWNGTIEWFSSGELNQLYTLPSREKITQTAIDKTSAKLFSKNTLLIGMYDTAAMKMSILSNDGSCNQAIVGFKPKEDELNIFFIKYQLEYLKKEILEQRQGVRQKNLNLSKIKKILIEYPPLKTQQKTVNYLNKISLYVERVKELQKEKMGHLKALKASILDQAFRGKLN